MISSSEIETPAYTSTDAPKNRRAFLFPLIVLAALWALLIYNLGAQWSAYEQYNYGWAVPILCLYLLYRRLNNPLTHILTPTSSPTLNLNRAERSEESEEMRGKGSLRFLSPFLRSPFFLLVALILCCLAYAPTRWLHEANPIWRLTSWLWSLEVIAITLLVLALANRSSKAAASSPLSHPMGETDGAVPHVPLSYPMGEGQGEGGPLVPWSLNLFFPIAFFLVAVPWPSLIEGILVNSFTSLNVSIVSELLSLFGIPAVPHGNTFEISSGVVGVDEACSGIRSFQATLMLSLFFGELYLLTPGRRFFCVFAGFAFSMIFNIGRTLLLVYVGSSRGIKAIANWHDPAGTTILVACFICLWLLARLLRSKTPHSLSQPMGEGMGEGQIPAPSLSRRRNAKTDSSLLIPWPLSLSLLVWLAAVELGTQLWYRSRETSTRSNPQWSLNTKPSITDFKTVEIPPAISVQFRADNSTEARWQDELDRPWQLFYFRWLPGRSPNKRVAVQLAKTHEPDICLPAIGMSMVAELGVITIPLNGVKIALQQFLFTSQGQKVHVFYGIYEDLGGGAVLANRRQDSRSRIAAAFAGSRNYGQQYLELAVWGYDDPTDARKALHQQLAKLITTQTPKQ